MLTRNSKYLCSNLTLSGSAYVSFLSSLPSKKEQSYYSFVYALPKRLHDGWNMYIFRTSCAYVFLQKTQKNKRYCRDIKIEEIFQDIFQEWLSTSRKVRHIISIRFGEDFTKWDWNTFQVWVFLDINSANLHSFRLKWNKINK